MRGFLPAVPVIARLAIGVVDPIPTLPFWRIVNSDVPVDEATLNGLVEGRPCTLNEKVDDVALIPATVPLSRRDEVPSVVAVSQRVAKPTAPPLIRPRVDVATQRVDVAVDWSTIPRDPVALTPS